VSGPADTARLLRDHSRLTSLPYGCYGTATQYRLDLDHVWYREWLFAGHDCELARPGDFLTLQVGDYPLLVVRDRDGVLRAFHNTCRHRGSRLCADAHGHGQRLTCPYHAWTYRLDGSLVAAPNMGAQFDPAGFALQAVHCESLAGFVFICLATDPPPFDALRQLAQAYVEPHALRDARVACESTIVEKADWKLVLENNRECYHCSGNHPELLRSFPNQPTLTGTAGGDYGARVEAFWGACEARGLPARYRLSDNLQTRVMRLPLNAGARSLTMSGQAAVAQPLAAQPGDGDIGSLLFYHFPSTWNHVLADHAVTFRVLPLSPTTTQLTTKWLVHRDAVEGIDYDPATLTAVWRATNAEDQRICEENQLGTLSPAYVPGPLSPLEEQGVRQFVDWYCSTLAQRL
jgi:Rieske 2Fe-2S family protein